MVYYHIFFLLKYRSSSHTANLKISNRHETASHFCFISLCQETTGRRGKLTKDPRWAVAVEYRYSPLRCTVQYKGTRSQLLPAAATRQRTFCESWSTLWQLVGNGARGSWRVALGVGELPVLEAVSHRDDGSNQLPARWKRTEVGQTMQLWPEKDRSSGLS